jgi:hypothetical protein
MPEVSKRPPERLILGSHFHRRAVRNRVWIRGLALDSLPATMYTMPMLEFSLILSVAASALAGWLLNRGKRLEARVEELEVRLSGIERQPGRADPGARVRELLGARTWAAPDAERVSRERETSLSAPETANHTDPGLRALVVR